MRFNIPHALRWAPEGTGPLTAPLGDVDRLDGPSVSPRPGNPHFFPAPMVVGSEEHQKEYEDVCEAVSKVKQGAWPTRVLASHGLPTETEEFPRIFADIIREKAKMYSVSEPMAAALHVRMDDWREPATIMFRNVFTQGGMLTEKHRFQSQTRRHVKHFDLPGVMSAHNQVGMAVKMQMERAFDSKYHYLFPRPYQCSNTPRSQFTAYPHNNGGDEHGEYVPGHTVNGAASYSAVQRATTFEDAETGELVAAENKVIAAATGWLRCLPGLHYFTHCQRVHDYLTKDPLN